MTLNFVLRHSFAPCEVLSGHDQHSNSSMWLARQTWLHEVWGNLANEQRLTIRCVSLGHMPMGIHELFARPAKYVGCVRHPVDRVISHFRFLRLAAATGWDALPIRQLVQTMSLDEWLESSVGLGPHNLQVRMLSGCHELDAQYSPDGRPIIIPHVSPEHLELAKSNIEKHFITIAPLEELSALIVMLQSLYGWPLRRVLFEPQNVNGPRVRRIPETTRRRIEDLNAFDLALFDWAKARFRDQVVALGFGFSRKRRIFQRVNKTMQIARVILPQSQRRAIAKRVLFRRNDIPVPATIST